MGKIRTTWQIDVPLSRAMWKDVDQACMKHLQGSRLILDLGCGNTDRLKQLSLDRVVGLDVRREYFSGSIYENQVVASAYYLPFRRRTFDGLHLRAVVHHLEVAKLFEELSLVCYPRCAVCVVEPLQGVLMRLVRRLVTTDYHEAGERPLGSRELLELNKRMRIKFGFYAFSEIVYLAIFILSRLPSYAARHVRIICERLLAIQKMKPFPPAYIVLIGSTT